MNLFSCSRCGVPRLVTFTNQWTDEGLLISQPIGQRTLVLLERELIVQIEGGIEEKLGIPLYKIITEAKRMDARIYVDSIVTGTLGKVLRLPFLRRLAWLFIIRQGADIGLGKAELLKYEPGKSLLGRADPVYQPAFFAGDVQGAYESFEKMRSKLETGFVGDHFYLQLSTWPDAPEEPRLTSEEVRRVHARAGFRRCPDCGVPVEISELRWEKSTGRIIDTNTDEWLFIMGRLSFNSIFRELEKELGEEIPRLIADITCDFYRQLRERHPHAHQRDLAFIKARGLGVPDTDMPTPEQIKEGLSIRNGFNGPCLAGIVAAVCGGKGSDYTWESPEEGIIRIRLA